MANESKETSKEKGREMRKAAPARALSPFDEMDRMFEGFFPRGWMRPARWEWPVWSELPAFEGRMPRVDVLDREAEILVRAELPGVQKKDLDVSLTDNTVTIRATTEHEEKEQEGDYYRREISRGAFTRTVTLPSEVDESKAKASFKDGILELTLPKMERAKRRTLQVE